MVGVAKRYIAFRDFVTTRGRLTLNCVWLFAQVAMRKAAGPSGPEAGHPVGCQWYTKIPRKVSIVFFRQLATLRPRASTAAMGIASFWSRRKRSA